MNKENDKFLDGLKDIIISVIVAFVAFLVITQFFMIPIRVDGSSMEPTLHDKNLGFSNVFDIKQGKVERFDIVVIEVPSKGKNLVKRVIGLPGDKVFYQNDTLYINDEAVEEPFLDSEFMEQQKRLRDSDLFTHDFSEPVVVPEGEYFVLGDNRLNSSDSRDPRYGTFKFKNIRSKNIYIYYPFNEMRKEGH